MKSLVSKLIQKVVAVVFALGVIVGAATQPAKADVTFAAASGTRAAEVVFDIDGVNLEVVLTNTSAYDVLVPVDVLTAVFFDITGDPALTRISALLTAGSTVFYDPDGQPAGGVVGGEWAYKNNLSGAPLGAKQGVSSTGVGLFGGSDQFPGADLAPPATSPDGLQYGLLSAGDDVATGNGGVTGSGGLIKNSVTFLLGSLPTGFTLGDISNVSFQYGTSLSEPNIPAIPEPETYAMLLAGLSLMGFFARRRKLKATA
jgi:hypothetical protein